MTSDAKDVFLSELESLLEQLQRSNRTAVHLRSDPALVPNVKGQAPIASCLTASAICNGVSDAFAK